MARNRRESSDDGVGEDEQPIYVISIAARLVGMHQQTLRYYERAGLVEPKRTGGNIRMYSNSDIERIRQIQNSALDKLKNRGNSSCVLKGATNQDAVSCADVVILAVPFKNAQVTLEGLSGFEDKIVISPINPMEKRDYFMFLCLWRPGKSA